MAVCQFPTAGGRCRRCPNCRRAICSDRWPLLMECRDVDAPQPGTELARLLRPLQWFARRGCQCHRLLLAMNQHGPDWCQANLAELADAVRANARGGWLVPRAGIKPLITTAIERSRRKSGADPPTLAT